MKNLRFSLFVFMVVLIIFGFCTENAIAEFEVYDANNQYLGILIDNMATLYKSASSATPSSSMMIFVSSLNKPITLLSTGYVSVDYITLMLNPPVSVYSENTDCSGTLWLEENDKNHYIDAQLNFFNTKTYFYPGLPGNPPSVTLDTSVSKKSFTSGSIFINGNCQIYNAPPNCDPRYEQCRVFYPLKREWPPFGSSSEQLPFTLPVAFPLKYKQTTFDIDGDRKMGLAESIFILQKTAGQR